MQFVLWGDYNVLVNELLGMAEAESRKSTESGADAGARMPQACVVDTINLPSHNAKHCQTRAERGQGRVGGGQVKCQCVCVCLAKMQQLLRLAEKKRPKGTACVAHDV